MRATNGLLILGTLLFTGGAALVLTSLGHRGDRRLLLGILGFVGAVACLGTAAWRIHHSVDWERVDAEQRLWESGPLGRIWLKIRQARLKR